MLTLFRRLSSIRFIALFLAFLLPASAQLPDTKSDEKEKAPLVRFICSHALVEDQEVVLASRNAEGKWQEFGSVKLRSSFITEWFPVKLGELHLTVREGDTLKSIGSFIYPADCRRAMAVLIPNREKNIYSAIVEDLDKIDFKKGSVLTINCSKQTGFLKLGAANVAVKSGERVVAEPILEANGMYRMMLGYQDEHNKTVVCYDRYIPGNPDSRDMLFLFPDKTLGLKVFSLPIFGDL